MSLVHSSGTQVCTNLANVNYPFTTPTRDTHEARFIFGFPSEHGERKYNRELTSRRTTHRA
jgi:hypothetical protein